MQRPDRISAGDWVKMTDGQVCEFAQKYPADMRVMLQITERKLSCHPAQVLCKQEMKNQKRYQECVTMAMQQFKEDAASEAARKNAAIQAYGALRPHTTNCMGYGASVSCNTW